VPWVVPQYSKNQVDIAGRTLINPAASDEAQEHALTVVNNWRASHNYPLNTFQATLRWKAKSVYPSALVAQRIKRLTFHPSQTGTIRRHEDV
jgi:hypothetical protein